MTLLQLKRLIKLYQNKDNYEIGDDDDIYESNKIRGKIITELIIKFSNRY